MCIIRLYPCTREKGTVARLECPPAVCEPLQSGGGEKKTVEETVCIVYKYNNYSFLLTNTRLLSLLPVSVPQAAHLDLPAVCKDGRVP